MITRVSSSCMFIICCASWVYPQESLFFSSPEPVVQKLYQMLKDVTELLHLNEITYWVDSGTLLGAVRHGGLIPWDDDLDLALPQNQEANFLKLLPVLELLGYHVVGMPFGYKIFPEDGEPYETFPWKYPGCDIFLVYEHEDAFCYKFFWQQERKNGPFYIKKADIFPLRWHCFGPIQVYGPCNPVPYLDCWYGNDWYDVAYHYFDHHSERAVEKIKMFLTQETRKAAFPQQTLKNRIPEPFVKQWPKDYVFNTSCKRAKKE